MHNCCHCEYRSTFIEFSIGLLWRRMLLPIASYNVPFVILLSAHENLFHFHSFFSFQVEKKENKIYRAHVSLSTWDSYALRQKKTLSAQKFTQKNKFDEKRVENRAAK